MSTLTITTIQSDLAWENKKVNLEMLFEKIEGIKEKTEVVILPEMFSTGFTMNTELLAEKMNGETVQWMKEVAISKKIILTGSLIIEEKEKYFNRLIWMLPNGKYGYYDKRHLFAFANEDKHYCPGNKRLIASVKGWKINLQVCYDLRFPVWGRQSPSPNLSPGGEGQGFTQRGQGFAEGEGEELTGRGRQADMRQKRQEFEYDVLVYVANWPEKRSHAWKTLLQARAIENQCYVIGVNRVGNDANKIYYGGNSMILDPLGEILYQKAGEEDIFTFTLQKEKLNEVRERFPFWKDADKFTIT